MDRQDEGVGVRQPGWGYINPFNDGLVPADTFDPMDERYGPLRDKLRQKLEACKPNCPRIKVRTGQAGGVRG